MNFDDVSVKVEMVDEEYEYNGSVQPNSSTMAEIKTEPSEQDESYGILKEPQGPSHSNSGILLGNPVISSPVISSPPIMNRAQFINAGDNYTMNAADVPLKKQIAALVKVAAPTTACTTIKQEVDRAVSTTVGLFWSHKTLIFWLSLRFAKIRSGQKFNFLLFKT